MSESIITDYSITVFLKLVSYDQLKSVIALKRQRKMLAQQHVTSFFNFIQQRNDLNHTSQLE